MKKLPFLIFFITTGVFAAEEKACPLIWEPVCGSIDTGIRCVTTPCPSTEEKTFGNVCALEQAKGTLLHTGECGITDIKEEKELPVEDTSVEDILKQIEEIEEKITELNEIDQEVLIPIEKLSQEKPSWIKQTFTSLLDFLVFWK